jgi:predicted porin
MNMFKDNLTFNADANLSGGFLILDKTQTQQVFGTRLGYLGIDMNKFGTVTVGKQWSVYYDITGYTDKFNVFGGQASATYVTGTDGGGSGTGRADQALIYRNQFGPVLIGVRMQARTATNNHFLDGYGFSAQVNLLKGLKVGAAFNKAFPDDTVISRHEILGLTGQPTYLAVGVRYAIGNLLLAAVYAHETNGDLTPGYINDSTQGILIPTVVFNADGFELYGKYNFGKMDVLAGYNNYNPHVEDITTPTGQKPVSPDFKRHYIIIGLEYHPINGAYFYAEQRISNGKTSLGTNEFNVFTLGIRIDVAAAFSKTIKR